MLGWVRHAGGSGHGGRSVELDIDLCAPDGAVCIQMRGFASRVLELHSPGTAKLPIKKQEAALDDAHYEKVLAGIAKGTISVDDAIELS